MRVKFVSQRPRAPGHVVVASWEVWSWPLPRAGDAFEVESDDPDTLAGCYTVVLVAWIVTDGEAPSVQVTIR
jgi:hypothetical protein